MRTHQTIRAVQTLLAIGEVAFAALGFAAPRGRTAGCAVTTSVAKVAGKALEGPDNPIPPCDCSSGSDDCASLCNASCPCGGIGAVCDTGTTCSGNAGDGGVCEGCACSPC